MPARLAATTLLILPLLTACATASVPDFATLGSARLYGNTGAETGSAVLTESGGVLELTVMVTGLTPGKPHGIHLHAKGACIAPGFASAGPHLNPQGRQHGANNPAGSHLGDLPNLVAKAGGVARFAVNLPGIPNETLTQLFDADGTAIVLHAEADDLRSDPTGNSGARIACGTLMPIAR